MEIAPRAGETGGVQMMVTGMNVRIAASQGVTTWPI